MVEWVEEREINFGFWWVDLGVFMRLVFGDCYGWNQKQFEFEKFAVGSVLKF